MSEVNTGAAKMAQGIKQPAASADDLSSNSKTHIMEGENQLQLTSYVCAHTQEKKCKQIIKRITYNGAGEEASGYKPALLLQRT